MKLKYLALIITFLIAAQLSGTGRAQSYDSLTLTPAEEHHIAELNAEQPFVAGFHVDAEDLSVRKTVDAVAVAVCFPTLNASPFPRRSWLGGGLFVQAQDHVFRNVDYGFYLMLVADSSGDLFIDLGLHQTRERTAPLHMPTADLIYAYTWRLAGLDPARPATMVASWDKNGFVHYSVSTSEYNATIAAIDVAGLPNCQNIIPKFYVGNVVVDPFPLSRYVNYFLFGVTSSETIADSHWKVGISQPKMLREGSWMLVDNSWSIQGDAAYLDYDWKWGGAAYHGVEAQYYRNPLEEPYELVFSYEGRDLTPGRVLWSNTITSSDHAASVSFRSLDHPLTASPAWRFSIVATAFWLVLMKSRRRRWKPA